MVRCAPDHLTVATVLLPVKRNVLRNSRPQSWPVGRWSADRSFAVAPPRQPGPAECRQTEDEQEPFRDRPDEETIRSVTFRILDRLSTRIRGRMVRMIHRLAYSSPRQYSTRWIIRSSSGPGHSNDSPAAPGVLRPSAGQETFHSILSCDHQSRSDSRQSSDK